MTRFLRTASDLAISSRKHPSYQGMRGLESTQIRSYYMLRTCLQLYRAPIRPHIKWGSVLTFLPLGESSPESRSFKKCDQLLQGTAAEFDAGVRGTNVA
ncbi:unnamed protein product [Pieris macdunnoughi]|uniref:Uncharacterized protein n=1 Tax=Pieris macdunnoughi TaxID=345717 RepID=A0A821YCT9_9NEOP|nr:unnamed protein product [Pieris macdunnoughi]